MKNPTTTIEAYKFILENAKKRMPEIRDCSGTPIRKVVRQGDIYAVITSEIENKGVEIKSRQLVPGISNGSRHVVADNPRVRIFKSNPVKLRKLFEEILGFPILA